jgi:hypothetical protein
LETLTLHIISLYRRVAASVAGIFDDVIDERIFGGPMVFWLPAVVVQKRQKYREQQKCTSAFSATPTTTMTFYFVKIHRAEL